MKLRKSSKKGFTLIELIVVIAILGILAAILVPVISGFIKRANDATDVANAKLLYNAGMMVLADENTGEFTAVTTAGSVAGAAKVGDYVNPWPVVKDADNGSGFAVTVTASTVTVHTSTMKFDPQTGSFSAIS